MINSYNPFHLKSTFLLKRNLGLGTTETDEGLFFCFIDYNIDLFFFTINN